MLNNQLQLNHQQLVLAMNVVEHLSAKALRINERECKVDKTILSLTSYGDRVAKVHLTIQSLLLQSVSISKIVLWLALDEFTLNDLPSELLALQQYGLEISFCSDIRSYKKLIPSLKKYPNHVVITFDDDVVYPSNHVERLLMTHQKYPNDIICHRAHRMTKGSNGQLKPYLKWQFDICNADSDTIDHRDIFPVGIGGVLYPVNCFDKEVLNEDAFMALAPNADDIWFKAMALKNNTHTTIVDNPTPYKDYLLLPNSQIQSLWAGNITANDEQFSAVIKAYPELIFS